MKIAKVLIALSLFSGLHAEASRRTDVVIDKINVVSTERRSSQTSEGLVRLYFSSAAWGTSSCRTTAADIIYADKHIYSAALAAYMSGKTVNITVDAGTKPHDDVCKIDSFEINP